MNAPFTDAWRAAGSVTAVGLMSGGLDSLLASKILMEQGFRPVLVAFVTPFFPPAKAEKAAEALGSPLTLADLYDDLLPLIKNPPHGRGRHLNPCVDCHALMLKKAGEILDASGRPGFLYTGEVLGQRPMSQNSRALAIVAEDSGRPDFVLRPLSARLLPPTAAERLGWADRERLMALSGRSRRAQLALAERFGLPAPSPAGGCLLTDPEFSRRFKWLMDQRRDDPAWPPLRLTEIIKLGRLFSAEEGSWLVVGRNQADNRRLAELAGPGDVLARLEEQPGPLTLIPFSGRPPGQPTLDLALSLTAAYGGAAAGAGVRLETRSEPRETENFRLERAAAVPDDLARWRAPRS